MNLIMMIILKYSINLVLIIVGRIILLIFIMIFFHLYQKVLQINP